MNNIKQFVLPAIVTILTACGGNKTDYKVEPLKVTTETVCINNTPHSRTYVGKVEEHSSTPVSFTSMGTVTHVYAEEGQYIAKGQLIAEMDSTQNKNALITTQAMLEQAMDAQQRMKVLHDAKAISDIDWIDVQTKVRTAESNLQMAKKALADCQLKAPRSGIVGTKQMENGMTALPSQPVCTILDITKVKVKVSVPEKEITLFAPSANNTQNITITAEALPGKTFNPIKLVRNVQGDPLTHTYDVFLELKNPDLQLLPGMVVSVSMPIGSETDTNNITVPIQAVQQNADNTHFVWLKKNNKAQRQTVQIGQTQGNRIVISSGLKEKDEVIIEGYQKVSEDSNIK